MKKYEAIELPAGSDADLEVTITDGDDLAINLSVLYNTILILYSATGTFIKKYSVFASAGWTPMTISGVGNNVLSFRLLSADTNLAEKGIVYYEVRTCANDIGATDDSKYDSIVTDVYLCTITKSVSSGLVLP